jgi:hypothetical protein
MPIDVNIDSPWPEIQKAVGRNVEDIAKELTRETPLTDKDFSNLHEALLLTASSVQIIRESVIPQDTN